MRPRTYVAMPVPPDGLERRAELPPPVPLGIVATGVPSPWRSLAATPADGVDVASGQSVQHGVDLGGTPGAPRGKVDGMPGAAERISTLDVAVEAGDATLDTEPVGTLVRPFTAVYNGITADPRVLIGQEYDTWVGGTDPPLPVSAEVWRAQFQDGGCTVEPPAAEYRGKPVGLQSVIDLSCLDMGCGGLAGGNSLRPRHVQLPLRKLAGRVAIRLSRGRGHSLG